MGRLAVGLARVARSPRSKGTAASSRGLCGRGGVATTQGSGALDKGGSCACARSANLAKRVRASRQPTNSRGPISPPAHPRPPRARGALSPTSLQAPLRPSARATPKVELKMGGRSARPHTRCLPRAPPAVQEARAGGRAASWRAAAAAHAQPAARLGEGSGSAGLGNSMRVASPTPAHVRPRTASSAGCRRAVRAESHSRRVRAARRRRVGACASADVDAKRAPASENWKGVERAMHSISAPSSCSRPRPC